MTKIILLVIFTGYLFSACVTHKSLSTIEWWFDGSLVADKATLESYFFIRLKKELLKAKPDRVEIIVYPLLVDSIDNGIYYYSICFTKKELPHCFSMRTETKRYDLLVKKDKELHLYDSKQQKNIKFLLKDSDYLEKIFGEKWLLYKDELLKGYIYIQT